MFIAARTAPQQSYSNPAERIMSLLNLALQNVAINREAMDEKYEKKMKNVSSIKQARLVADKDPEFKVSLMSSTRPVITLLKERFSRLIWKEVPIQAHDPCTDAQMEDLLTCLLLLDDTLDLTTVTKSKTALAEFIKAHCKMSHYMFQVLFSF